MTTGKTMFLDIGSSAIKMVEINRTQDKVLITKAVTLPDASRYLSSFGIEDLDGLLEYIITSAEAEEITAKRVYIASSALGIKSRLEITEDGSKGKEVEKSNTKITASQLYGTITYDNKVTTHSVVSVGTLYTLKSLVEAFAEKGYTVVSIEDSLTTTMNLVRLDKFTYNYPGKVIVSFGNKTEFICYSKDVPVSVTEFERKISEMIEAISAATNIDPHEIGNLFYKHGLVKTEESVEYLIRHNIHPDSYYDSVRSYCAQFLGALKEAIDAEADNMQLGRCFVIVTGGFADVPGMYDMLEHEFADEYMIVLRNAIPRTYENDYLLIQNKTGLQDIGAVYGNCTGLLLKEMFKTTINLLPAKIAKPENRESIANALNTTMKISIGVCAICALLLLVTAFRYMRTEKPADTTTLISQYHSLQAQGEEYEMQLNTLKKIDKVGGDILKYCDNYIDSDIRVVSIDTLDLVNSTPAKQEEAAETEAETPAADEENSENDTNKTEKTPKNNDSTKMTDANKRYVIRGYASRASAATEFYNSIRDAGYKSKATMADGVRSVALPSGETMFIFEIYIDASNAE